MGSLKISPLQIASSYFSQMKIHRQTTTTRDKINLKWNSILEEHMIEKCAVVVHDMAQNLGPLS